MQQENSPSLPRRQPRVSRVRACRSVSAWLTMLILVPLTQSYAALTVVADGQPRAVVITADTAGPTAVYAAEKLIRYVARATGAVLPSLTESELPAEYPVRIFIGDTEAARTQGIDPEALERKARNEIMRPDVRWRASHPVCLIKAIDGDLFIVGNDHVSAGHALADNTDGGTLYGVNELLDRRLGVLWLWPGELGTYVPLNRDLVIPANIEAMVTPRFDTRVFRRHHIVNALSSYDETQPRHMVSFSRDGLKNYLDDLNRYLVRHRVRGSGIGQFYVDHVNLWPQYGESNPEWFMQHEDGRRGPVRGRSDAALCVSNPELQKAIIEEVWDGGDYVNIGEIDHRSYCHCEQCLEWDQPQPEDFPHYSTSNRYARFWQNLRDLAVEKNPDVRINVLLYVKYLHAPTIDLDLRGIQGKFCPWFSGFYPYYPMSEENHQLLKQTWLGWRDTGMIMAYRPNNFHADYVMPHISTWQAGEMFKFAHRNDMAGFDFDALFGHWAAKGPMLYVHMRLADRPRLSITEIRREFFSAFGPAAGLVEEYFDYWEQYAGDRPGGHLYNPINADLAFPPEVFPPAETKLQRARRIAAAHNRPEYEARVAFLQAGLEHARMAARFIGLMEADGNAPRDPEKLQTAREALRELIAFRRRYEHLYIADFVDAGGRENRRLDLDTLLE